MKIDQLPVEMLIKIFNYLPTFREVSSVNRIFYVIACTVNDSTICLRIDLQFCKRFLRNTVINGHAAEKSVISSNRQINTVEIVSDKSDDDFFVIGDRDKVQIISVIARFSETITCLKLAHVTLDYVAFLEILSLIPNVERLELKDIFTKRQSTKRRRYNDDDLNLTKLKSLLIVGCCVDFVQDFSRLPAGVLTELHISCHWSTLARTLNRQFNIKKLVYIQDGFSGDDDDNDSNRFATVIFGKLKLTSLILCIKDVDSRTMAAILSKQTKLKSLILNRETVVDDRVMNAVASLAELEILSMNVSETRTASLTKIGKLNKLQDLRLRCVDSKSAAKMKATSVVSANISIRKLSWEFGFRIPIDLLGTLAKSAPNLTHLNVLRSNFVVSTDLDAILTHFNFVEVLHISLWGEPSHKPGNYFNAKLGELAIFVPYADQFYKLWLSTLTTAYPNTRKFTLIVRFADTRFKIRPILDAFTKLESLTLETSRMVIDDLDYLRDHKNNLKFVSLGHLEKAALTDELVSWLCATFGVVKVHCDRTLSIAVDRYTMKREREPFNKIIL